MNLFDYLQTTDAGCRVCPTGAMSMVDAVDLVTRAIEHCRRQHVRKLLVDTTALTAILPPSLLDRFLMAEDWARASAGLVVLAMVARPDIIHPQRFGLGVARDGGMHGEVFTTEADALAWLAAQP